MLFRGLLTQLSIILAVSWLQGESHLVFLCRPPLSPRVLPLTSLAGVLSTYPTSSVLAESNLIGTLLWLPSLPALLLPQPAPSAFCNFSSKLSHTPTSHAAPLHLVPPYLLLSLHTDPHLALCLWAVLLWAALTPSLLDGHSEKRDIVPLRHWRKLRPPET